MQTKVSEQTNQYSAPELKITVAGKSHEISHQECKQPRNHEVSPPRFIFIKKRYNLHGLYFCFMKTFDFKMMARAFVMQINHI